MAGGDIKGGGMTYYETNQFQNPSLVYGEGLRVPNVAGSMELDGLFSTGALGKRKSFDRGVILHFRSNATQQFAFHAFYGGFKKSIIDRYLVNFWWKVFLKRFIPIYGTLWMFQVLGQRDYDNNAYAYFYFSD